MPPVNRPHNPNAHWRSLDQLADTPEFRAWLESEFPAAMELEGISRRRWLQLMGASLALAGATGCRWEKAEILPLAKRPDDHAPGKSQRFATSMELGGSAIGLMVTSVDGRPVKIEGNPKHPASRGATSAQAQAAILGLYDPDRSRNIVEKTDGQEFVRNWDEFTEFAQNHFAELRKKAGQGFAVLAEPSSSPTRAAMRAKLLETFPEAKWYEYDPISRDNERAGAQLAFGKPYRTHYALDQADVILCLDADPLGCHPMAVRYAADFAQGREVTDGKMNRLYAVESGLSVTGAAADHRLAMQSGQIADFTEALLKEIMALTNTEPKREAVDDTSRQEVKFFRVLAADLVAHRGRTVVMAGPQQAAVVHHNIHVINETLGNVGKTITYTLDSDADRPSHHSAIGSLNAAIIAGEVQTLLVLDGNPAYNAPAELELAKALEEVETQIHLGSYRDETARRCTWHLPQAHFLESWGDGRAYDGTYGVVQPLIEPLWDGKTDIELLALLTGNTTPDPQALVRQTAQGILGEDGFQPKWRQLLHDGLAAETRWPVVMPETPAKKGSLLGSGEILTSRLNDQLEIVFTSDSKVHDGRFANNGWLQEMPDPITRLTWGNAAIVSPATAKWLGVQDSTLVKLKLAEREIEIPAYILPGQADGSVAVALGYGRTAAGAIGGDLEKDVEPVGVDVYKLRNASAYFGWDLTVEPTGRKYPLAGVQDHHAIDTTGKKERKQRAGVLVREATLQEYQEHPDFAQHVVHHPPLESLWKEHEFEGHRWGMVIDLSKCIGCGSCVVACQAENNVPIVGKQRVMQGREMHWLRVDRYFKGHAANPQVVCQPVPCQQCELAPCEQVCPVAATVHSEEGLNDQVYNRCVGTRYCANNCPYKVRRFNYFNYHKNLAEADNEVTKMMYNPEVTVRSRGVMEKCTYCVQRIQAVKIEAKNARRPIEDGEIKTACQQACPSGAIVFGDLAQRNSRVARLHDDKRNYAMLGELNNKPRTTYLAKIRNPNPELEG